MTVRLPIRLIMSYYGTCDEVARVQCSVTDGAQCSTSSPKPHHEITNVTISTTSSCVDMTSIDIGEIIEAVDSELMSTSAVLSYCKSKILYPYLRFLSFMGLRPVSLDQLQNSKIVLYLWHYHTVQISLLICLGYFLQYMSCFRRDRGFCYKVDVLPDDLDYNDTTSDDPHARICYDGSIMGFMIPNVLHFSGYIYAIYLFRISDNEQLQHLMERVFLLSSFPPQGTPYTSPRRLVLILWFYIFGSIIWTVLSLITMNLMMMDGIIEFHWIIPRSDKLITLTKVLLAMTTLTHDMVQATIITSYCLQAQLLTAHLDFLRNRLLTRTISSLDWMREVAEFRRLLRHLNEVLAPVICIFTIVNISWACSGLVWLVNLDKVEATINPIFGISFLNETLWILASIVPFISAARLTRACSSTQTVGHEIIVRPFLHQDTPQEDLNTVLLFASTLQLSARLFRLPITGRYLCLALTLFSIVIFTLSMCHYLQV